MIFCLNVIEDRSDNESGQVLNLLPKENDVEVCCLLEQLKFAKEHIETAHFKPMVFDRVEYIEKNMNSTKIVPF